MMAQDPIRMKSGTVGITDSSVFPASKDIAAALVEIEPGGLRELQWHPNANEWQYYISGQARVGAFAASGQARTFDFQSGDVGFVPYAMGHYAENTGTTPLRSLELFKSSYYADLSLNQWLALPPAEGPEGAFKTGSTAHEGIEQNQNPGPVGIAGAIPTGLPNPAMEMKHEINRARDDYRWCGSRTTQSRKPVARLRLATGFGAGWDTISAGLDADR
jgi:oxalate decarboxylase/phosphoglucose isomerase-like protein (cupin superfamily)